MSYHYEKARKLQKAGCLDEALKTYNAGIALGDIYCMYEVAQIYRKGESVETNYQYALELYLICAKRHLTMAKFQLGRMYQMGMGTEKNSSAAIKWYVKASNKAPEPGSSLAQYALGYMYFYGDGVEQNYQVALEWYKKAAEQNECDAEDDIGYMYNFGYGVNIDYQKAYYWYNRAAINGSSSAQFHIGQLFEFGRIGECDYEKALEQYKKADSQGDPRAKEKIAWFYYKGLAGLKKNEEKAIELFREAANQGVALAQYSLGVIFFCKENYKDAFYWYTQAAEHDDADAQDTLGFMYANGLGISLDINKARAMFERSSSNGNYEATYNLGAWYVELNPEGPDYKKAIPLWESASQKGCNEAYYKLGYAYYDGLGVEQNYTKALEYFEQAHKNGYHCSYAIDMIKNELARKKGQITHYDKSSNQMRAYADELLKQSIPTDKLPLQIQKDLKEDFGDYWNKLNKNTRKFLETALFNFITYYSFGERMYGNFDFSSVITPMFKALENEIGKYVYTGYIHYLVENNVSACEFPLNRTFIKSDGKGNLAYRKANDMSYFTLGSIDKVIGLSKNIKPRGYLNVDEQAYTIDKTFKEYLIALFTDDALGTINKERAIVDYIIDFSREIKCLTDSIRNPAAHGNVMSCAKAEECGNYLIKVKKLLLKFIEKIKPEYFS